jgi:tetratricopeptide (TPR) repeat protein
VAEGLAEEQFLRHRESAAAVWRDQAQGALLDALALDGGLLEARLRLGRLLAERRGRHDEAARAYTRALEGWPDSARLALGHAVEKPSVPRPPCRWSAASLARPQRLDRAAGPWWLYLFGPPGLAKAALDRVWTKALDR